MRIYIYIYFLEEIHPFKELKKKYLKKRKKGKKKIDFPSIIITLKCTLIKKDCSNGKIF